MFLNTETERKKILKTKRVNPMKDRDKKKIPTNTDRKFLQTQTETERNPP